MRYRLKTINYKLNSGFTLLEFLIYFAIIAGIGTALAGIFIVLNTGKSQSDAKAEVDSAIRLITDKIKTDVKDATVINTIAGVSGDSLFLTTEIGCVSYNVTAATSTLPAQMTRRVDTGASCETHGETVALSGTQVKITSATFTREDALNPAVHRVVAGIRVNLTVAYNSDSPDLTFSQNKEFFVDSAKLFSVAQRGPDGGGSALQYWDTGETDTAITPPVVAPAPVPYQGDSRYTLYVETTTLPALLSTEAYLLTTVSADFGLNGQIVTYEDQIGNIRNGDMSVYLMTDANDGKGLKFHPNSNYISQADAPNGSVNQCTGAGNLTKKEDVDQKRNVLSFLPDMGSDGWRLARFEPGESILPTTNGSATAMVPGGDRYVNKQYAPGASVSVQFYVRVYTTPGSSISMVCTHNNKLNYKIKLVPDE